MRHILSATIPTDWKRKKRIIRKEEERRECLDKKLGGKMQERPLMPVRICLRQKRE